MPDERVSMRRVREILCLKHECGRHRSGDRPITEPRAQHRRADIATGCVGGPALATAVGTDRPRAGGNAVSRPRLLASRPAQDRADWAYIRHELRRPAVTLMLLCEGVRIRRREGSASAIG